jgi:5-methylcytosine-specific restriction endonuclease McrA
MEPTKSRYLEGCGFIDPKTLPINAEGYRECRYCHKSVKPPKRSFCSNECVHEYRLRSDGTYLRLNVFERDHGICAICNIDTKDIAKKLLSTDKTDPSYDKILEEYKISKKRKITPGKLGGGLWDADHIVCVKDGGGCSGLDNLRTLCISCHKIITFSR